MKGGHGGQRPLLSNTASLLIRYLPKRRLTSEALFTGRQGSLSRRRIQQLFKDYAQKAGLEAKYSVHSLRHSIATHLLDAGIDIADVRDHLGHVNIQNTLVYAQLTDKRRIEFFRKVEASGEIVKI